MAIRYDKGYNTRIQKIVAAYNQTRKRLERQGYKNLPQPVKVSSLKTRFKYRSDLNKELTQLSRFSRKSITPITTEGGAFTTKWELMHLKRNAELAKDYFIRRYRILANKIRDFPGEMGRLRTYQANFLAINVENVENLTPSEFKAYRGAINTYFTDYDKMKGGYRGFMSQVLNVMRTVGIDEKTIDKVMSKLNTLTPEQFTKMYEESDLISRIYELADSPKYTGGELIFNTSDEDAERLINMLIDNVDSLVKEAKKEPEVYFDPLEELYNSVISNDLLKPERTKEGKIKRSSLTPQWVSYLKALGMDDLIDEDQ